MEKSSVPSHQDYDHESLPEKLTPVEDVSAVTHNLPWQAWAVVISCALWNGAISCFQITCLFWSGPMIAELGGGKEAVWLGQSFQVVTAVLGPVLARVGDSCGRRYPVLLGIFGGIIGAIVMATAQNFQALIAGTAIFGLAYGSGGNVFTIPSEVLPRAHRGTAQVLTFLGAIIGVLLGLFVDANFIVSQPGGFTGWRSACWFNCAYHILTFVCFAAFYHPKPVDNPEGLSVIQRFLNIDLVGCALLGCGITPLMMGIVWGGQTYAWSSAAVIACLVVGVAFFLIFGVHQTLLKKDGLCHHDLFKNRNFAICTLSIFVEGMIYNVFTHYYGEMTAVLWDGRPYFLALRFAAFVLAAASTAPFYGYFVYRFRDAKPVLIFGYGAFLVALIGLTTAKVGTNHVAILWAVFAGIGFAAPLVFLNMVTQLSVSPMVMGLATSLIISSRSIGGALGVAIGEAIFSAKANKKVPAYVIKAAIKAGLPESSLVTFVTAIADSNAAGALAATGSSPSIVAAGVLAFKNAYMDSLRFVFIMTIPFVAVGMIGLVLLKSTKKEMTAVVDRGVEGRHHH